MKPPCIKNGIPCAKRHLGCQGNCPDLAALHEHNEKIRKAREQEAIYISYIVPVVLKQQKRK